MIKRSIYSLMFGKGNKIFYFLFGQIFLLLSFAYFIIVGAIKILYKLNILKSAKLNAKVISIGNITWGGTGKTSLVLLLAKFLQGKDIKTAILIRGYGDDEDKMLRRQLEGALVLSGRNRLKNAKAAEGKYRPDAIILDDGFQHWRIRRDLDIVTINALNPFGNKNVIPAGILREPLFALRRAGLIVLTKTNLVDKEKIAKIKGDILRIDPKAEIFEAEYKPVSITSLKENKEFEANFIKAKRLCAVSGLGDNISFFKMLKDLGADLACELSYPDHHRYTLKDIKHIINSAKVTNSNAIITTKKDWIRLEQIMMPCRIDVLLFNITIKIADENKFYNRISALLNR